MNKTTVSVHRWYAEIKVENEGDVEKLYVVYEDGVGLWLANEEEFTEWIDE